MYPTNTNVIDLNAQEDLQPSLNIGSIGHVAHGKSTLVRAISGKRTQQHTKELEKNMTIKLGYANAKLWKCPVCIGDAAYTSSGPEVFSRKAKCTTCSSPLTLLKHVSFVDCPGHEILMETMLNGAAVMDAALLLIAADQPCPSPQTVEHLSAVELMGLRNILVVQNKIDLLTEDEVRENYYDICKFTKNTVVEKAPVIPICAQRGWNVDTLCKCIAEMPVPERDIYSPPLMMVIRSFDVNKPGEDDIANLQGAVVGGSLLRGHLTVGQTVEMRPGRLELTSEPGVYRMKPIRTKILSMFSDKNELPVALTGGLIALGTTLDPSLGRADKLVGQVIGQPGKMPEVYQSMIVSYLLVGRATKDVSRASENFYDMDKPFFKRKEEVKLNIGNQTTTAIVKAAKADLLRLFLKIPCCTELKSRVSISIKNESGRWSLAGVGMIRRGTPLAKIADPS